MEYTFSVKYDSGTREFNGLDLYQGAHSLAAISEIIMLCVHASVHKEIVVQAPAAKGFKIVMVKSRAGSYEQFINMVVTDPNTQQLLQDLGKNGLYDFIKFLLCNCLGIPFIIANRRAKKKARELEMQNEDLHERLEKALIRAHIPIKSSGYNAVINLGRTPIVEFNNDTLTYLETEKVEENVEVVQAAISRFNARTGTGRLITSIDSQSFSFSPLNDITSEDKEIMADNLGLVARGEFRQLNMEVTRILSVDNKLKRYRFHGLI